MASMEHVSEEEIRKARPDKVNKTALNRWIKKLSAQQESIPVVFGSHGLGLIQSLGEKGIHSVIIDDGQQSYRDFSRYCSRITVPDVSSSPGVLDETLVIISRLAQEHTGRLPIMFPTSDYILDYITHHYENMQKISSVVAPSLEVLRITLHKVPFYQWLIENDLPCPRTVYQDQPDERNDFFAGNHEPFPCIIKPDLTYRLEQRVNKKMYIATNHAEFMRLTKDLSQKGLDYIIQEIVPGKPEDQFSLAGYCTIQGEITGWIVTNKLRQSYFGAGTFVSSAEIPYLYEIGEQILNKLHYSGIFEIEFRKDSRDGRYKIIEFNPRCWSQIMLATRMNVNVAYHAYCDHSGRKSEKNTPQASGKKRYWVNIERDLGHLKNMIINKDFSIGNFLMIMRTIPCVEPFNLRDPWPGIYYLRQKLLNKFKASIRNLV